MEQFDVLHALSTQWLAENGVMNGGELSSSRTFLEPILEEETTEDEDEDEEEEEEEEEVNCHPSAVDRRHRDLWVSYEHVWSSDSETDSVIEVLVKQEPDAVSERDFVCPAKRRRRDFFIENSPKMQKSKFGTDLCEPRSHLDDDIFYDDSLSYQSLSRSSSLIQFESLERQMQCESFGNSTPSLVHLTDETDCGDNELKSKLKINFFDNNYDSSNLSLQSGDHLRLGFGSIRIGGALGNNSFSNGIAAHSGFERKCLLQQLRQEASDPVAKFKRECIRSRNSAENLSDDSGYCESAGLKRKSKSIPTLNANSMDYMGDYDEYDDKFENSKSLNSIVTHVSSSGGGGGGGRKLYSNRSTRSPSTSATPPSPMPTACTVRTASHSSGPTRRSHSTSNNKTYDSLNINTFASCSHHMPSTDDAKNNWRNCDGKTTAATQNISQSLPDLCDHTASKLSSIASFFDDYNHKTADDSCYGRSSSHPIAEFYVRNRDVSIVSSVPNELNLSAVEDMYNELEWCERELNVIRLNQQLQIQQQQQQQQQHRIINSSHYNLTALDYSAGGSGGGVGFGNSNSNSHHTSSSYNNIHNKSTTIAAAMSNKSLNQQKRKSDEINTCNFLLDEMSMNFNRDISIINDRSPEYEPPMEDCVKPRRSSPPQPPPRKLLPTPKQHNPDHVADHEESAGGDRGGDDLHNNKCVGSHDMQSTFGEGSGATNESHELNNPHETKHSSTFDLDPTNLVTCYALSMERCNFDIDESNEPSIKQQYYTKPTTMHQQRSLVVSTPNLSTFKTVSEYKSRGSNNRHTADDHRSRNQYLPEPTSCSVSNLVTSTIPCNELQSILHNRPIPDGKNNSVAAVGAELSRTSLKEVSFCPVVSQFTWNQASTETDDSGEIDCGVAVENGVECHSDNTTERAPINIQLGDVSSDDSTYGNQMSGKEVTLTTMGRQTITMTNNTVNDDRELTPATECDRDTPADAFSVNKKHTNKATSNTNNKMNVSAVSSNRMQQCVGVTNDHASSSTTNSRSDSAIRNGEGNAIVSGERERVQQQQSVKNKFSASEYPSKSLSMLLENVNPSSADAGSANSVEIKSASGIINNNKRKDELFMEPKKKHKRGFLSRLSGFRFSLRGKKKHQSNATSVDNNKVYNNNGGQQDASDDRNQITSKCPDFVYIPLKEPTTNVQSQFYVTRQSNDEFIANERRAVSVDREDYPIVQRQQQQQQQQKVTTKPPLPRQAPRVVGVCAKPPHVQGRGEHSPIANSTPHRNDGAGHAPRTTQFNAWKIDDQRSILRGADPTNSNRTWSGASADQHEEDDLLDELERDQCDYRQQQRSGVGYAGRVGDTSNYHNKHSGKIGLIETNLDTHETIITGKTRSLIELGPQMGGQRLHQNHRHHHHHHNQHHQAGGKNKNDDDDDINIVEPRRPHKSMEFLLDKENQRNVIPPENELQKIHDGNNPALSEHQLRVQASLQRLNIPDWFKQYTGNTTGAAGVPIAGGPRKPDTIYSGRRRNLESGGWAALNSKTTSLSSLGSNRSERSPVLLSPSAHSHHGQTGYSRWSTSQINSSQTSPSVSTRGSFSRGGLNSSVLSGSSITYGGAGGASSVIRNSMRQPYYGWRSQEKLSQPRTPAERLASSLMTQQQHHQQKLQEKHQQQLQAAKQQHQGSDEVDVTPEIQSSIKEVTSAIVHYVNDQNNRTVSRSRSTSPSARKCWLESSFVGNRPLDSPQTPIINNSNSFSGGQGGSLTGGENTVPLDNTRINSVGELVII